jgi:hypothetical protein
MRRSLTANMAQANELHFHAVNDETVGMGGFLGRDWRAQGNVAYFAAALATHMGMGYVVAVKTFLRSRPVKAHDFSGVGQQFKIAVNRSQADAGQLFPHQLVYLISGRMSAVVA